MGEVSLLRAPPLPSEERTASNLSSTVGLQLRPESVNLSLMPPDPIAIGAIGALMNRVQQLVAFVW
jgi:hypothetical protein